MLKRVISETCCHVFEKCLKECRPGWNGTCQDHTTNTSHTSANKSLYISWSENNHNSIYNLKWIRNNCYTEKNLKSYKSEYKLWNSQFAKKIKLVVYDYKKIISDDKELKKWLKAIC